MEALKLGGKKISIDMNSKEEIQMKTPEQKFMEMIELRKQVVKDSFAKCTDERLKACDSSVLFYLDRIEEDFKRAFGYENE